MSAPNSAITKFGQWLEIKRNFYRFSILAFGVPFWLFAIWLTHELLSDPFWILFLGVVSFGGAVLWAFGMWHFVGSRYSSIRSEQDEDNAT